MYVQIIAIKTKSLLSCQLLVKIRAVLGYEQLSPIDILGYSMNIASKITSLTGANKVSIGENVYKSLDRKVQREFHELSVSDGRWKYINYGTDKPYKVYTLNS
jgi:adenylate cyclase